MSVTVRAAAPGEGGLRPGQRGTIVGCPVVLAGGVRQQTGIPTSPEERQVIIYIRTPSGGVVGIPASNREPLSESGSETTIEDESGEIRRKRSFSGRLISRRPVVALDITEHNVLEALDKLLAATQSMTVLLASLKTELREGQATEKEKGSTSEEVDKIRQKRDLATKCWRSLIAYKKTFHDLKEFCLTTRSSRDITNRSSKEVTICSSEEVTKCSSEEVTKSSPKEVTKSSSKELTKFSLKEVTKCCSKEVSKKVTNKTVNLENLNEMDIDILSVVRKMPRRILSVPRTRVIDLTQGSRDDEVLEDISNISNISSISNISNISYFSNTSTCE